MSKFTQHAEITLPPCSGCEGHEETIGELTETKLYVLVSSKWLCRICFGKGAGRSYPRPRGVALTRALGEAKPAKVGITRLAPLWSGDAPGSTVEPKP